jgi:hypothetical protein
MGSAMGTRSTIRGAALGTTAVLVLALQTGCGASSEYMRELPNTGQVARSADSATVVFIRPSGFGGAFATTILDNKGRFLGDSMAKSYFAVTVPPGEHVFLSWAENTGPLRARVEAGKIYFIEVAPKMGFASTRVHLLGITPRVSSWSDLDNWLRESKPYQPDEPRGQAYLQSRSEDVAERIRRANEALMKFSQEELAERTIEAKDGK